MGLKNIERQLARWIGKLTVYNMEIVHRPGKDYADADGLSRIPDLLVLSNYYSYDYYSYAVAESNVYGRINNGIGFTMRCIVSIHMPSSIFHMTRVILSHRKMSPGWISMRRRI